MRLWRRRRQRRPGRHWAPPSRVPDNDQVVHPGDRRSVDIIRAIFEEPTQPVRLAPLLTPGQRARTWRSML